MLEETVLFTSLPECEDLCRFICEITDLIVINGCSMSLFHTQLFKCRSILATFPDIIAAPRRGTEKQIEIIARKNYFENNKHILIFLENANLSVSEQLSVNLENYRECILFTIKFKLAPSWIRVGQYLCQENEIFTNEEINGIKFDISVKKMGMILKFSFYKLKINPLKLVDLQLFSSVMFEFKENPKGAIELGYCWANVLPSTFKARLVQVSKQIPESSPFRNYQELRSYWKQMYGYLLPESSEGILYYEVCFKAFPNEIFLYPSICLHSENPKIINYKNGASTCIQFVEDLENKVASLCGKMLSFEKTNPYESNITSFISAKDIKKESPEFSLLLLSSNKNIKSSNDLKNGNVGFNLKQQTLNFPTPSSSNKFSNPKIGNFDSRLKQQTLNFLTPPSTKFSETLNSTNTALKNESIASKICPDFPATFLSQAIVSAPIKRKLILDQKREDDSDSQNSETYKDLLNLIKYNETSEKKNYKERNLLDSLMKEKSPPKKRVKMFKTSVPPLETVSRFFKEIKSTVNNPIKNGGNKLQLQNLKKNN